MKKEMEEAERSYDLNRLAELKYGKLPELQKQLAALEKEEHSDKRLLKEEVDEDDIAKVVSTWTGIPVNRLMEREKKKLAHLPEILHKRVIGQDEAVEAVSEAVIRARADQGSQQAHWLLHLPGAHRCGQDRTGQSPGRSAVQ